MAAFQDKTPSENESNSGAFVGLAKFAALVTGLILLAWGLMKLLAIFWPE